MSQVAVVSLSSIRENPVALRAVDTEGESYLGLRDSIRQLGLLNPISVRQRKEDVDGQVVEYFEIVDGLHRYTASQDAGLTEIPVNIIDADQAKTLEAQIVGNLHRVDCPPVAYTKQLQRMFALNPTLTISDMAVKLAKSPSWISQRLNLLKLAPEIQELVDTDKITVANAVNLAKLPQDEQLNYVDQAITMRTDEFAPTVAARAKELKEAAKEGRGSKPAVFEPVARQRRISELKDEYANPVVGPELCRTAGVKTVEDAFALGVAYAICLDPVSIAAAKAADEEKKQKVEEAKKRRAAERAKKRADEAAEAAAKAQEAAGLVD